MRADNEKHVYGRIPRSRRPLAAVVLGAAGGIIVAGSVLTSWLTASPVSWWAIGVIVGATFVFLGVYLWIRLSD